MTVSYTKEVATQTTFGVFLKLLFRWKGGIYKIIWPELLIYLLLYYAVRCIYTLALNEPQRRSFEKIALYFQDFSKLIPISFVLGFYISIVMSRWWNQYLTIPWPTSLAVFVTNSLKGNDERGRMMRRTIMRYANLAYVITLTMISPPVKKRFPTMDHLVNAGFLNTNEKAIFDKLEEVSHHPKYWMPIVWASAIVTRARREGRIRDDFAVQTITDSLNIFRAGCRMLISYDTISLPLVYTQVVTLAVYFFFVSSLIGGQFLDPAQGYPKNYIDHHVPWFTLLQFFFYMGWLKVAENFLNPFGENDDDFDMNYIVDRNIAVSYLIVDEMHNESPDLIQDKYWDEVVPQDLPYTAASQQFKSEPPMGSASDIEVSEAGQVIAQPTLETVVEEREELAPIPEEGNDESIVLIHLDEGKNKEK